MSIASISNSEVTWVNGVPLWAELDQDGLWLPTTGTDFGRSPKLEDDDDFGDEDFEDEEIDDDEGDDEEFEDEEEFDDEDDDFDDFDDDDFDDDDLDEDLDEAGDDEDY